MEKLIFQHLRNLEQKIKYGAALYVMIAIIAIPVGICNFQSELPDAVQLTAQAAWTFTDDAMAENDEPAAGDETISQAMVAPLEAVLPAPPFYDHIIQAAQTYQVDAALIRAIIMAESNYNPNAVSHRGAQGLMQLMPATAKWLGVADAFDPALNIDGGVRYFKDLLDRFEGDVQLALAAYNAGSRHVRNYGGVPPFRATRAYIKKVLKYHRLFRESTASGATGLTAS